jgi:hypothetical protein
MKKLLAVLTLILFVAFQLVAHGAETAPATAGEPVFSEEASKIMTRMTEFISKAPAFSLTSDTGHEIRQPNGHMLEYGSHLALAIQRPSQEIGRFEF